MTILPLSLLKWNKRNPEQPPLRCLSSLIIQERDWDRTFPSRAELIILNFWNCEHPENFNVVEIRR